MGKETNFLRNFLLVAILASIIVWFTLSFVTRVEVEQYVLTEVKNEVAEVLKARAVSNIPEEFFRTKDFAKYKKELDHFFEKTIHPAPSLINLADNSSFIIYSNSSSYMGKSISGPDFDSALDGKITARIKEDFANKNGRVVDLYIPLSYGESFTQGVLELNFPMETALKNLNTFLYIIWLAMAIALASLLLIIFLVFRKTAKTILENSRAVEENSSALKLSKDQDEAILESIDEGLVMINKSGQIITFNPKAEKMTAYNNLSVTFRHYKNSLIFTDKDGKRIDEDFVKEALEKGIISKKSSRDEIYLKDRNGKLTPVSLISVPIVNRKEGKTVGSVITMNDASKEKELDKVKDEFVYVVAHELGNPIFIIGGYLSMLLEGTIGKIDKKARDTLKATAEVNEQLSNLVNDLLEVIRSESGQMKFDLEPVDIGKVAQEVTSAMLFKAKNKKINLDLKYKKNLPKVKANPQKLKEVLTNLIDNAIKYSPEGKGIEVYFEEEQNGLITTSVKDHGFGMTKEEASKLFEKFYRIKNDKTSNIQGTGLGLFIVRQLVEKMNGKIWAESEPNVGSTFSFSLKIVN